MMKAYMTIAEFQEMCGISRSTVYRLEQRGEIDLFRIGRAVRISRDQAHAWCEALPRRASNHG